MLVFVNTEEKGYLPSKQDEKIYNMSLCVCVCACVRARARACLPADRLRTLFIWTKLILQEAD